MSNHLPYFLTSSRGEDYTDILRDVMTETKVITPARHFMHRGVEIMRTAKGWSVYGKDEMYLSEAIKLVNNKLDNDATQTI